MADYYPLIARAIAGLDQCPGDSRRALYERARTALIAQLRSVDPPLSESDITRERLSLEEAIRKVESEAAARARDLSRPDSAGRSRPGDAFRASPARRQAGEPRRRAAVRARRPSRRRGARQPMCRRRLPPRAADRRLTTSAPERNLRAEPRQPARRVPQPYRGADAAPRDADRRRRSTPPPLRGFRDVIADADDLGGATARPSRAAREDLRQRAVANRREFDRLEPIHGRSRPRRRRRCRIPTIESVEEAARYQQPPPRTAVAPEQDKKRRRGGAGGRLSAQERDCARRAC